MMQAKYIEIARSCELWIEKFCVIQLNKDPYISFWMMTDDEWILDR